jgi:triosephosphate isomerase (TIM)
LRRRLIVGNWKMNKTASEAGAYVHRLSAVASASDRVEVVLAPPFTALQATAQAELPVFPFLLAAQNMHWEDKGAFTGDVAPPMLKELGCRYVILGHSERRQLFGERDEQINRKVRAALRHGIRPILCLGESLDEREGGRTDAVVTAQLERGLEGVEPKDLPAVTLAYEPVWAIGTGRAASPAQAAAVHATLRKTLSEACGTAPAEELRILYGGSVTAENAGDFLSQAGIDGALVGGACLDPHSFARIIAAGVAAAG